MIKNKSVIFILILAIAFASFALFVNIVKYKPIYGEETSNKEEEKLDFVPIFSEDPILGNKNAPKTIIAFEDFGCTRCKDQMDIFRQLMEEYPNQVKIIWKSLDSTKFPYSSELAHSYAYCANEQDKFAEFEKIVFESENISEESLKMYALDADLDKTKLTDCLSSERPKNYKEKNEQLADTIGIYSIPTIFINNKSVQEPLTLEGWKALLSL
jgi:protein-disulfide isomerase